MRCTVPSASVSLLVTLHASSKVTFYSGFIMVLYLALFHTFWSCSLLFHLVYIVLTGLFFVGFFFFNWKSTYMLAAYQSWCVKVDLCIVQQKWVLVQLLVRILLVYVCVCLWVITSVSANRSSLLYLLPDLQNPPLLNMSTLISALCLSKHTLHFCCKNHFVRHMKIQYQ
jgi:hypothetical protein